MTTKPLKKGATYDDLREVPEHFVAELFDGDLWAFPRPALPHANAAASLLGEIYKSFPNSGPSGWVILFEPELHFGKDVLVPDVAGWRRTRLPQVPDAAYLSLAPDWICEVLSASTEEVDRGKKLRIYAREGVAHAWLIDPIARSLEVLSLDARQWLQLGRYTDEAKVRAVPFDTVELELRALWI
jgi:Uma2 family endonuclease